MDVYGCDCDGGDCAGRVLMMVLVMVMIMLIVVVLVRR